MSLPSTTFMPSSSMVRTGAMPLMRLVFESAQCTAVTPQRFIAARSRLSLWTQCAISVPGFQSPYFSYVSQYCAQSGCSSLTHAISLLFSERCDCTGRSRSLASFPSHAKSSSEQDGVKRGVSIGRTFVNRSHASSQRRVSRLLSSAVSQ